MYSISETKKQLIADQLKKVSCNGNGKKASRIEIARLISDLFFKDYVIVDKRLYLKTATHCELQDNRLIRDICEQFAQYFISEKPSKPFVSSLEYIVRAEIESKSIFLRRKKSEKPQFNLQNAVLEIDADNEIVLRPRNNYDFFTYAAPYPYDPNARCDTFQQFLDDILPDKQKQRIVLQFIAYCFYPRTLEKCLMLIGPNHNAKTALLSIIELLLGKNNISRLTLSELRNQKKRHEILDKIMNISIETNSKTVIKHGFYQLVSNEEIGFKIPYRNFFTARYNTRFIFVMNAPPSFDIHYLKSFTRRILLIEFEKSISDDKVDPLLLDKIKSELSGIFNLVINELRYLNENHNFSKCDKSNEAIEAIVQSKDSFQAFVKGVRSR